MPPTKPRGVAAFNRSIRVRLVIWTVFILAVVVVVLTSLIARNAVRVLETQTAAQVSQLTAQSARAVADFLDARERTVDLWAADSLILSVARDPGLRAVFLPGLNGYLVGYAEREPWIADILVIADGAQIFSLQGLEEGSWDASAAAQLTDPETPVLHLIKPHQASPTYLAIRRQAVDGGQPLPGIFVVLLLDIQVMQDQLLSEANPSPNGFVALQDRDGAALASTPVDLGPLSRPAADIEQLHHEDFLIERHVVAEKPLRLIGVAARSDFEGPVRDLAIITVLLGAGAIILGLVGTLFFTGRVTAPIRKLTNEARLMASSKVGSTAAPHNHGLSLTTSRYSQDEVGELASLFELLDRTTEELTEANSLLEVRNHDLDETRGVLRKNLDRLELEMNTARRLQLSMVAGDGEIRRFGDDVQAVGLMEPAREVGGDFYDSFTVGEGAVCFFIGDVSDKGTASALFMSRTVSLVRFAAIQLARTTGSVPHPSDVLAQVNEELCKNNSTRMFVTLFLCILDTNSGEVTFANAGHTSPMLSSGEMVTDIASEMPDLPLGVRAHAVYQTRSRLLGAGDRLVLYTDGVTEAENTQSEFFGVESLSAVVLAERNAEANILIQSLRDAIFEFADGAEQFDDITMLIIGWKPMG